MPAGTNLLIMRMQTEALQNLRKEVEALKRPKGKKKK